MAEAQENKELTIEAAMAVALGSAINSLFNDEDEKVVGAALALVLAEWLKRIAQTDQGQEKALDVLLAATARHMEITK
jgi:hypothetical protein